MPIASEIFLSRYGMISQDITSDTFLSAIPYAKAYPRTAKTHIMSRTSAALQAAIRIGQYMKSVPFKNIDIEQRHSTIAQLDDVFHRQNFEEKTQFLSQNVYIALCMKVKTVRLRVRGKLVLQSRFRQPATNLKHCSEFA
jgi:hypothetical protein